MNTEEKANRYDEALERAKYYYAEGKTLEYADDIVSDIFPELKESSEYEDEKIKQRIIKLIKMSSEVGGFALHKWEADEMLAWLEKQSSNAYELGYTEGMRVKNKEWLEKQGDANKEYWRGYREGKREILDKYTELEKQGEQTSDKIEPKFKNGQWIVWIDKCYKVNYNGCGYELVDQDGLSTSLEYGTIDENAHLWDITKDAKDGDVLANNNGWVGVFKVLHSDDFTVYCFITKDMSFSNECCVYDTLDPLFYHIHPATKEQREQLEKAMADAGCTFDFEEKVLRKIEHKPNPCDGCINRKGCINCENGELRETEHKPANKVEPKFKVGDWLQYRNAKPFLVEEITKQGYVNGDSCLPFNWENEIHFWTIQDAKDGDVLSDGTTVFIFKDLLSDGSVMSHCDYDADSGESDAFCPLSMNLMCSKITPATKEQRDLLFRKMKEAGYEWNSEKKELKKIEQKPACSEVDERFFACIENTLMVVLQDGKPTEDSISKEEIFRWLKSLKDRVQPQPKQEWSEEDVALLDSAIAFVEHSPFTTIGKGKGGVVAWLNSLKDRMIPQQAKWSEEDERIIIRIDSLLYAINESDFEDIHAWLESLKDRYTWKPSEKQMRQLHKYCIDNKPLNELYEQLKAL